MGRQRTDGIASALGSDRDSGIGGQCESADTAERDTGEIDDDPRTAIGRAATGAVSGGVRRSTQDRIGAHVDLAGHAQHGDAPGRKLQHATTHDSREGWLEVSLAVTAIPLPRDKQRRRESGPPPDENPTGPATQAFLDQLDAALGGEAARLSAAAGPRVRLPLFHPALFEVAAGQNWGVSMVSLRVRDVPVVVTLAGHLPEIPADALDRSSQLQGVRLPVPASSRRSSPTPPSRPLGAVISDWVWGASVVGSGAGERRA